MPTYQPDTALGYRHERIGLPECPYLERWVLNLGPCALRLHHWLASDDQRHFHDHGWWFITVVLQGGYVDVSTTTPEDPGNPATATLDVLQRGSVRFRPATYAHKVSVNPSEGCWTLLLTGRRSRDWGFWVNGEWKRMRRYFRDHGHHPCE